MQNAIKFKTDDYGKKTTRTYVDAPAVFAAIRKHLPGEWTVRKQGACEQFAASTTRYVDIVRAADGLRLEICASTNYDREPCIKVSMCGYSYPASGQQIDLRWCCEKAGLIGVHTVWARMSIAKTTAEKLAKTIARRVITPAEKVLPFVMQLIADAQAREDQKQATIRKLQGIEGVSIHVPSYGTDVRVDAGDAYGHVQSDGGLRIEHLYIDREHAAAFCKFMAAHRRKRD